MGFLPLFSLHQGPRNQGRRNKNISPYALVTVNWQVEGTVLAVLLACSWPGAVLAGSPDLHFSSLGGRALGTPARRAAPGR